MKRGDVLSARVEHSATHLIVSMKFARLDEEKGLGYRVAPSIITESAYWWAEWEEDVRGQPPLRLYRGSVDNVRPCDGFSRSVDFAEGVVTLRIPRECLSNPPWVRVSLFVGTWFRGAFTRDYVRHDGPVRMGSRYSQRILPPGSARVGTPATTSAERAVSLVRDSRD